MMKKFLSLIAIALSSLFLVLSLAGIAGIWMVHSASHRVVNNVFDAADQARADSSARVIQVIAQRQGMQTGLDELSAEIDDAARRIVEAPVVFLAIDQILDGKLLPALTQLDQAGRQVYADLADLSAAVKALNNISLFRDQQGLLDEIILALNWLLEDLQRLDGDFRALEVFLRDRKSETIQNIVAPGQALIAQMNTTLNESQTRWQDLQLALEQAQRELDSTRAELLNLITLLTILITVVLGWLAISQYLALRYAWMIFREQPALNRPD